MRRTARVTRYLLGEIAGPTILGLSLYTFVLLSNAFFLVARTAITRNLGWDLVARLFAYEIPQLLVLTVPMATLLGVLVAVGRLSADHELVALQSAGLGWTTLIRPVLIHGAAGTIVAFAIYSMVVPQTSFASRRLQAEIAGRSGVTADLTPRVFYNNLPGVVLFVDEIRAGTQGKLEDVLVYQYSLARNTTEQVFLARSGNIYPPAAANGKIRVELSDGVWHIFNSASPDAYRVAPFGRYTLPIETPEYMKALSAPPDPTLQDMTLPELFDEKRQAANHPDDIVRELRLRGARIQIHQRFALPLACLFFALLGLPLGMTRARTGKGAGFALSVLVFLVYYLIFTVARDQAAQGRLPVVPAVWSGNLVTLGWTIFAFRNLRTRRAESVWGEPVRAGLRSLTKLGLPGFPRWSRARAASPEEDERPRVGASMARRVVGLIDRHIVIHYLRVLGYALLAGYVIFSIVDLRSLLDGAAQGRLTIPLLVKYFAYFVPGKLSLVLPLSCLVASVIAFTVMGRNGELTALKASGFGMRRATAPVLLTTAALCGALFLVQDRLAPVTSQKAQEIRDRIQGAPPRTYGFALGGRWAFGSGGRLYHYQIYDSDRQTFQALTVFTVDRTVPRVLDHRFAASARWSGSGWILETGWHRTLGTDPASGSFRRFDRESADLDPPETFARREVSLTFGGDLPDQMTLNELGRQIAVLRDSGYDTTRLQVAYHAKLAQPLTPLVMALLGLPFAFQVGRRGSLYGLGIALLLVIVYWATFAIFNALGIETILPPLLAAWAPNVLYGFAGAYMMLFVRS